jgi:hypothetical protein
LRVRDLILPGIATFALAGAPAALAATADGPGSGGTTGGTTGPGTTTAPTTTPTTPAPTGPGTGGVGLAAAPTAPSTPLHPTVPGFRAKIIHGIAYAPAYAPIQVQRAIWAGNRIRTKPYILGGGHGKFASDGYDCSGSVSYVLHGAGLLKTPLDSSEFMTWGDQGLGSWITVYTNPGHAFIEIAGIRFDTSAEADPRPAPGTGPRWRPLYRNPAGYVARHPLDF